MTVRRLEYGWVRYDGQDVGVHLASADDTSPYHLMYPTGYDARCSYCWLNIAHSEDAHAERIA